MRIERVRIKRVAEGEDAAAWKRALEDASWLAGAKVLKDEPGSSWVRRATVNGRDVVVKCRLLNTVGRRVKAGMGMGHGAKQWRGAARLARAKIATAKPLLLAECEIDGAACEVLALEHVAGPTVLEVLAEVAAGRGPRVREQHEVARAVGANMNELLNAHLWNRDHKPSNLIVLKTGQGAARLSVIDCVAIKRLGLFGLEPRSIAMAANLMTEPIGCGCRPRRALWMRVLVGVWNEDGNLCFSRNKPHDDLRAVIGVIGRIVPPRERARPRVDPLARANRG